MLDRVFEEITRFFNEKNLGVKLVYKYFDSVYTFYLLNEKNDVSIDIFYVTVTNKVKTQTDYKVKLIVEFCFSKYEPRYISDTNVFNNVVQKYLESNDFNIALQEFLVGEFIFRIHTAQKTYLSFYEELSKVCEKVTELTVTEDELIDLILNLLEEQKSFETIIVYEALLLVIKQSKIDNKVKILYKLALKLDKFYKNR